MLLTITAFRDRFTQAEKIAIYTAADSIKEIRIWLDDLAAVTVVLDPQDQSRVLSGVDPADPRTVYGVRGLEAVGLIGPGRADEILNSGEGAGTPVGGLALGQSITLRDPFGKAFPGAHPIVGFGGNSVLLEVGEFDLSYVVEAV